MGSAGLTASVRSTSMAVSRGQALRPKSSTRCYSASSCPSVIPSFPSRLLTGSLMFEYTPQVSSSPVSLWLVFQTVFYIPRAPQRNSLTAICELLPVKVSSYPTWNPTIIKLINKISFKTAAAFANWGQKAPASPREGGPDGSANCSSLSSTLPQSQHLSPEAKPCKPGSTHETEEVAHCLK